MRRLSAQTLIFIAFFAFTLCPISNAANPTPNNAAGKNISLPKNFAQKTAGNNLLRKNQKDSSKLIPSHAKKKPQLSIKHTRRESRWKSIPDKINRSPSEF